MNQGILLFATSPPKMQPFAWPKWAISTPFPSRRSRRKRKLKKPKKLLQTFQKAYFRRYLLHSISMLVLSWSDCMHVYQKHRRPKLTFRASEELKTHAPQLYSLALTRFCWNLESSTTNAWNVKNAIFSRASRVTFGPWITWRSCIAAAPTNPNRACQLGFDLSVHVVALYAISHPEWQLFVPNFNRGASELFALELTSA